MTKLIGVSLSEHHINGIAVCELYIIMVCQSCEVYAQHDSMDISVKYSIAHSHALAYVRCSNLANCKFTLVQHEMTCHER